MTTDFAQNFLTETPSRTRERVLEALAAMKAARGRAHELDLDMVHGALTQLPGYSYRSNGDSKRKCYSLSDRGGLIMNLDFYPTRKLDGHGNKGESIIMMEYKGSSASGFFNLDAFDEWLERLERDVSPKPVEENVAR